MESRKRVREGDRTGSITLGRRRGKTKEGGVGWVSGRIRTFQV